MRIARGTATPTLTTLMFHGLARTLPPDAVFPGTRTCIIRQADFEACIAWCTANRRVIRLRDVREYTEGRATEPGVLITFDDGLASVIDVAVPILRKYAVTAVLFVTAGLVDQQVMPPILALERQLWTEPPQRLDVVVGAHAFSSVVGTRAAVGQTLARLWAFCFANRIAPLMLDSSCVRLDGRVWTPPPHSGREGWLPARWDEIKAAVREGVLEIGAHGMTHTPWSWVSGRERMVEIVEARERIQAMTGAPVTACSYPHGLYDEASRAEVRRHYDYGFTTQGRVFSDEPHDCLPRFHVPSERPVSMRLIVKWPRTGRIIRKGMTVLGHV